MSKTVVNVADLGPEQFSIDPRTTNAEIARFASELERDARSE